MALTSNAGAHGARALRGERCRAGGVARRAARVSASSAMRRTIGLGSVARAPARRARWDRRSARATRRRWRARRGCHPRARPISTGTERGLAQAPQHQRRADPHAVRRVVNQRLLDVLDTGLACARRHDGREQDRQDRQQQSGGARTQGHPELPPRPGRGQWSMRPIRSQFAALYRHPPIPAPPRAPPVTSARPSPDDAAHEPPSSPPIALAYSVDADDAFMFHALRAGRIEPAVSRSRTGAVTPPPSIDWRWASASRGTRDGAADVVAISAGVYPRVAAALPAVPHGASVGAASGRSWSRAGRWSRRSSRARASASPG